MSSPDLQSVRRGEGAKGTEFENKCGLYLGDGSLDCRIVACTFLHLCTTDVAIRAWALDIPASADDGPACRKLPRSTAQTSSAAAKQGCGESIIRKKTTFLDQNNCNCAAKTLRSCCRIENNPIPSDDALSMRRVPYNDVVIPSYVIAAVLFLSSSGPHAMINEQ